MVEFNYIKHFVIVNTIIIAVKLDFIKLNVQ